MGRDPSLSGGANTSPEPLYGDGSDGKITRSSDGTENGLIYATSYTLEAGVTRTVSSGTLIIHATKEIVINGTLDGTGLNGGAGGVGDSPGSAGAPGLLGASGSGGAGGRAGSTGNGSDGGPGAGGGGGGNSGGNSNYGSGGASASATLTDGPDIKKELRKYYSNSYKTLYNLSDMGGSAGGGGGGGSSHNGGPGNGGDGGGGGAGVVLVSPSISGPGSILCAGEDGADGQTDVAGGGGGGGGSGGLIAVIGRTIGNSFTTDVSAGLGGVGGGGDYTNSGGDGGDGIAGEVLYITS